jgi:DNA-binding NtrC family response regulator
VRQLRNVAERLVVRWAGRTLNSRDVSHELTLTVPSGGRETGAGAARAHPTRADDLYRRVTEGGECFWAAVHDPFMARDLTRDDVRSVVTRGLKETGGKYKPLLRLFNMKDTDYKRLLAFLGKRNLRAIRYRREEAAHS